MILLEVKLEEDGCRNDVLRGNAEMTYLEDKK